MNRAVSKSCFLLPALLALVVNLNVLQNGFVWDDIVLLTQSGQASLALQAPAEHYYRPVVFVTYAIDRKLWGEKPFGYHLTNLLLHAANTVLVFFVGCILASVIGPTPSPTLPPRGGGKGGGDHSPLPTPYSLPLIAASIFAVHPVHAEAVAWIAGRNDLLPTFFLLIAALAHLAIRSGGRTAFLYPVFLLSIGLALLSKEAAAPFLLVFPLYDLLVWRNDLPRWRRLMTPTTGLLGFLGLGFVLLRLASLGSAVGNLPLREGGFFDHAVRLLATTGFYVKHLVFPYPLNALIWFPETGSAVHGLYPALGGLTILLAIRWTVYGKNPWAAIGSCAVLLGLAAPLVIGLTTILHAPVAERYLYLPSVGFVFLAASVLLAVGDASNKWGIPAGPWPAALLAVAVVSLFSIQSFLRNPVWKNEIALWGDTAGKTPDAAVPHNRLGRALADAGRFDEAERELRLALEAKGDNTILASAATNLGGVYYQMGRLREAEEAYRAAQTHQDRTESHFGLGIIEWDRARGAMAQRDPAAASHLSRARDHLLNAVIRDDSNVQAHHALALVNLTLGNSDAARRNFEKVVELRPDSPLGRDAERRLEEIRE